MLTDGRTWRELETVHNFALPTTRRLPGQARRSERTVQPSRTPVMST
jgi:hypothetical protein